MTKRIILGVSGASGVILALDCARALKAQDVEIHLVLSKSARLTWQLECTEPIESLLDLADAVWQPDNMAASIASGSFVTDGMIVCPCSMKTVAGIVTGYTDNLLLRSADVCLKEGRKVVLVPREMPLGRIHLRNLKDAADYGCVIIPPVLTFYGHQTTMEEQIHHITGKILRQFDLELPGFRIWQGV